MDGSARGRIPPIDDEVWMKTKFAFVDEDGHDRVLTGERCSIPNSSSATATTTIRGDRSVWT